MVDKMNIVIAAAAMAIMATPASANEMPALLYGLDGNINGIASIADACEESDGSCTEFRRSGTIVGIERNKKKMVTSLLLRTHGLAGAASRIVNIDMAFGDGVMEFSDPIPPRIWGPASSWLRVGMRVTIDARVTGADGGMTVARRVQAGR